jgi:hypothetical protein
MAWVIANTGEAYKGETHEFLGKTFSGKTRTTESRRLEWESPKPASLPKPKQPRAKAAPKPRGATAWD